jgi:hypothetical protein
MSSVAPPMSAADVIAGPTSWPRSTIQTWSRSKRSSTR